MKKFILGLITVLSLLFIGALALNNDYASIDSLIRPPKIDGVNRDIQTAFELAVGDKYVLKSPLSGEYRTSFIRTDIDGDKYDEVVVFYCKTDAVDVIRMNILDEYEGVWESVADLESAYNDVYQISFANVDKDICKELIVCWRNFETDISSKLCVYKITDNSDNYIETIFSKNYSEFLICDVNSDKSTDIVLFEKTNTGSITEIKGDYYTFSDGIPTINGEFTVDPAIASIGEVCSDIDPVTKNMRIYIDGYKSDSGISTDAVIWNSEKNYFQKLNLSDSESLTSLTSRSININCSDINGDKIVDIPLEEFIPESVVLTADSTEETVRQSVIKWCEFVDGELDVLYYEILNPKYSYSIKVIPENYGNFTVRNDTVNGTMTFYELLDTQIPDDKPKKDKKPKNKDEPFDEFAPEEPKNSDPVGEALFEFLAAKESDYGAYEFSGYKYISAGNGFNYYCRITEAGKINGITKDKIKSSLIN